MKEEALGECSNSGKQIQSSDRSHWLLLTAYCSPLTAHRLLLTAYCLPLSAYRSLLTASSIPTSPPSPKGFLADLLRAFPDSPGLSPGGGSTSGGLPQQIFIGSLHVLSARPLTSSSPRHCEEVCFSTPTKQSAKVRSPSEPHQPSRRQDVSDPATPQAVRVLG